MANKLDNAESLSYENTNDISLPESEETHLNSVEYIYIKKTFRIYKKINLIIPFLINLRGFLNQ